MLKEDPAPSVRDRESFANARRVLERVAALPLHEQMESDALLDLFDQALADLCAAELVPRRLFASAPLLGRAHIMPEE